MSRIGSKKLYYMLNKDLKTLLSDKNLFKVNYSICLEAYGEFIS